MPQSETKWTPGPWRTEVSFDEYFPGHPCHELPNQSGAIHIMASRSDAEWEQIKYEAGDDGRDIVTTVLIDDWIEPVYTPELQRAKATANLIAAAPDLYDALERLLSATIQTAGLVVGTVEWAVGFSGERELIEQCRAALAKARGEQIQDAKIWDGIADIEIDGVMPAEDEDAR